MSRYIKETTRPHAAGTIEGLATGGGGLATIARRPLISDRGGEVSHVWIEGGKIIDPFTRGINQVSGWANSGAGLSVLATPPGGDGRRQVEGLTNFGSGFLQTGVVPVIPAGDFSCACVFANPPTGFPGIYTVPGTGANAGFEFYVASSSTGRFSMATYNGGAQTVSDALPVIPANVTCVGCCGRAGNQVFVKANLGTLATATPPVFSLPAPGVAKAQIGSGDNSVNFGAGTIYEVWIAAVAPSDALFTAIATEVKGKLGISAW